MPISKSGHKSINGLKKTSALQEKVAGEVIIGINTTVVKDKPHCVDENRGRDKKPEAVNP